MDAKPQRPRAFKVQDENAQPESNLARSKPANNPSTAMLSIGGLKAAAKRTAFGDVSNTAKTLSSNDEGLNGAVKSLGKDSVKPLALQEKPAAFSRPAQRPLNSAAVKVSLVAAPDATTSDSNNASKASLGDVRQPQVQPAAKRTLSKRGTTVFKDSGDSNQSLDQQQVHVPDSSLVAPVHQALHRNYKSQPQLRSEPPVLRRTQSKVIESLVDKSSQNVSIYQDSVEEQDAETSQAYQSYMQLIEQVDEELIPEGPEAAHNLEDDLQERLPLRRASEPEEYWEEEEDEEIYDEQGYTTAHSYRGESTTGGATTILMPKVTNKAKKELAAATAFVESGRTAEDLDDEAWDTSMVAEYGDEIFAYMRELEIRMLPNAHYMDNQAEIQWSMRSVLMDWLIQVHHRFTLLPETLFLCVNYIDRFLSCKIVSLGKLQLVGATAIFVAAKYEEINCPSVNEIVYMVDGGYTVDEILKAERFMLSMLQFELGWPGPMSFLRRISKADDYDLETRTLAKYFLEVTIMDERFVGSPPSYAAAGAHCLARMMLKKGDWSQAHIYYSGYTWQQLRPLVSMILQCCETPQKHHSAVFDKYSDRRYKRASIFVQAEMSKGFALPALVYRRSLPFTDPAAATQEPYKRTVQTKA